MGSMASKHLAHPYRQPAAVEPVIPAQGSVVEVILALLVGVLFCAYLAMHPTVPRSLLHPSTCVVR